MGCQSTNSRNACPNPSVCTQPSSRKSRRTTMTCTPQKRSSPNPVITGMDMDMAVAMNTTKVLPKIFFSVFASRIVIFCRRRRRRRLLSSSAVVVICSVVIVVDYFNTSIVELQRQPHLRGQTNPFGVRCIEQNKRRSGYPINDKKKTEEKVKRDLQREKLEEQNASFVADSQQSEQKKKEKERNRNRNRNRNTEHRKNSKVKQTTAPCVGVCCLLAHVFGLRAVTRAAQ